VAWVRGTRNRQWRLLSGEHVVRLYHGLEVDRQKPFFVARTVNLLECASLRAGETTQKHPIVRAIAGSRSIDLSCDVCV
jgi:hypothetical protein